MNKRNSIILGLLFVILVVEIIVLAPKEVGIHPDEEVQAAVSAPKTEGSGQVMQNFHLVEAKAEGKEWELWGDRASRPNDNEQWTIEKVRVKFFASNGVTYTVTGEQGIIVPSKEKSDIRIQGNVVTRSSNGYVFKTESALYDSMNRRLTSPTNVEMTGPQEVEENTGHKLQRLHLTGGNMVAEFGTNEIRINRDVRAKKGVKGDRLAKIQSDRALFSGRTNLAQFFGNVIIDVDTMRITGPEAKFAYDPRSQALQSMLVEGGIKVTDTDKFATSSAVNVHFKDESVVFTGAPRVVQNGDELIGDEIIFREGGKKVEVSNARAFLDSKTLEKKN